MARRKWTAEEIAEYRKAHGSYGYFNKEDSNIFVHKAYGFGWTLNWGNPLAWVVILLLIGLIVWLKFLR